jgi:hypothetical protein
LEDIPKIAKEFSDVNFIIRPHPAENRNVWMKILNGAENFQVINQGNIVPWLIASNIVIHNGCTTAVESFILGKKVISYRPFTNEIYDLELPNSISLEVFTYKDLVDHIYELKEGELPKNFRIDKLHILSNYISSIEGKFAFEKISDELESISSSQKQISSPKKFLIAAERIMRENLFKDKRTIYSKQKFPYLTYFEIQEKIDKFKSIIFHDINYILKKKSKNVFFIEVIK